MSRITVLAAFAVAILISLSAFADAPCPLNWRPDQLPGVAAGQVLASTTWDPDGAGPLSSRLVLGGSFLAAGNVPTVGAASWDGANWQAMPNGFPNDGTVYALAVHNGDLILASTRIKRWNGANWEILGTGLTAGAYALASFNSDLIAATPVPSMGYIARLNGGTWQPLAQGLNNSVYALTVFNGELIAGGDFTTAGGSSANRVARWNGTSWQPLGGGVNNTVQALAVYNDELIAAGSFSTAGGLPASWVARWDGANWQQLGGGLGAGTGASALSVFNNQLFIGGNFTTAAGDDARFVVRWDGVSFQPLGIGTDAPVKSLTTFNGALIAGGSFSKAGPVVAASVAQWDGVAWTRIGTPSNFATNGPVSALLATNTDLYAGGEFTTVGPISAARIARWNGSTWQSLGSGIGGPVRALTLWNDKLIAAGSFGSAGDVSANNVARWNGSSWEPLGPGLPAEVKSLGVFRGDLVAGGTSLPSNGQAYVARWNGTTWDSLSFPAEGSYTISSMTEYNNDLVGGPFFFPFPSRWDGLTWQFMPTTGWSFGWANAMLVDQGSLVAAGGFMPDSAGGAYNFFVRRFNGASWVNILPSGTQNVFHSEANALCRYGDALVMGVVRLNPTNGALAALVQLTGEPSYSFGSFGVARDPYNQFLGPVGVYAMASYNGDLIVGGAFSSVAGIASPNLARFGPSTELPAIAQQPIPKKVIAGGDASFHVATFGGQPQTYQWRRNTVNVTDDPHIAGSNTDTLTISPVSLADAGQYDCVVSNACGTAPSNAARLTVLGTVSGPLQTQFAVPASND